MIFIMGLKAYITAHFTFKFLIKVVILGIIIALVAIYAHDLIDEVNRMEAWIKKQGPLAPFLFALVILFFPVFGFPTDPICFAAGVLFGAAIGIPLAVIGMWASAVIMFFISRYFARKAFKKRFDNSPRMAQMDKIVEIGGMKVLLILRILPIPFSLISYFIGITKTSFKHYFISVVGTMGTVAVAAYAGAVATHVTKVVGTYQGLSPHDVHLITLGVVIILLAIAVIMARKALKQIRAQIKN